MQSYVITIYRFGDSGSPGEVLGTFTDPASGSEQRFANLEELHTLVDRAAAPNPGPVTRRNRGAER